MEEITNRQVEIGSLSKKEFVGRMNREIEKASNPARLTYLFAEASIAEAGGRITIENGREFYGNMAVAASDMAYKDIKAGRQIPKDFASTYHIAANSSLRLSIAASERMVRGLENQTPDKT